MGQPFTSKSNINVPGYKPKPVLFPFFPCKYKTDFLVVNLNIQNPDLGFVYSDYLDALRWLGVYVVYIWDMTSQQLLWCLCQIQMQYEMHSGLFIA